VSLDEWVTEFLDHFGEPSVKQQEILDRAFRKVALSEHQQFQQAA